MSTRSFANCCRSPLMSLQRRPTRNAPCHPMSLPLVSRLWTLDDLLRHSPMSVRLSTRHSTRAEQYALPAPSSSPARRGGASSSMVSCGNSARSDVYSRPFHIFLLACLQCLWASATSAQAPAAQPPAENPPAPAVSGNAGTTSLPLG